MIEFGKVEIQKYVQEKSFMFKHKEIWYVIRFFLIWFSAKLNEQKMYQKVTLKHTFNFMIMKVKKLFLFQDVFLTIFQNLKHFDKDDQFKFDFLTNPVP